MKYIRTKNGELHFNLGETQNGIIVEYNYLGDGLDLAVNYEAIKKQADTIEELCDEIVIERKEKPYHSNSPIGKSKSWKAYQPLVKVVKGIYGAIWTKKGLIYVARMNDKGELKLL